VGAVTIPADTTVGAVHLSVADLDRSVTFYERAVGLRVREREDGRAALGAGDADLLVLREQPGARPARRASGLFHFALLLPERVDLARWLLHAARSRVPLTGASDHFVSEALYLRDPDEHGIEIYWDRPRASWEGQVRERLTSDPLDTDDLLATLGDLEQDPGAALPSATVMGHVHLRVGDVPAAAAFYADVLGFESMATLGSQAAFLGAGGYHHHLGLNSWESRGAGQPPPGSATLERATIVLPDRASRDQLAERVAAAGHETVAIEDGVLVDDPSGNTLALLAAG
jgi:catechol 2,3-dioxygenase